MLSLPPLFPHDVCSAAHLILLTQLTNLPQPHALWYPSLSTNPQPAPTDSHTSDPNNPIAQPHPHHQQAHQQQNRPLNPQRTLLSTLRADESALQTRKANIRRFGAGWLRPPGVGKTLQGIADERAEREEVESARAREFALQEAQAAAEAEAMEGVVEGGGEEGMGERDLDDEVPEGEGDADADAGWMSEEEEGDGEEGVGLEEEGVEGGDLDDEVPEGEEGSYEHTDTEVEDSSSSEEEGGGGVVGRGLGGPRLATFNTRTGEVVRTSVGGGGVLASSVFGSSPVQMGGQRRGGIGGGGRGGGQREN